MHSPEVYMQRCLQLASRAAGYVAPNPMVGSVLVAEGRIIGEGYHQQYGGPHAEVNCIASVREADQHLIAQSTLYVSLEPCAHWGKTPPCADLIIQQRIPAVVVGCRDPFAEVDGKGIEKLRAAGVEVTVGVLENQCIELNKRFFVFHRKVRPWVLLKWAQTVNGLMGSGTAERLLISGPQSARLVHKWRSEEAAIMVGTNTAQNDDPQLTLRHWPGKNLMRTVLDMNLRLPPRLKIFNGSAPTIIFNSKQHSLSAERINPHTLSGVHYYQIREDESVVQQILNGLHSLNIQSVLVEGGAQLLQSFINENAWDEARIITSEAVIAGGLPAPQLRGGQLARQELLEGDTLRYYSNEV